MRRKRKPKKLRPPELTEDQILDWADAFHRLTGTWPSAYKHHRVLRVIHGAPAETWSKVNAALERGYRGLAGGSSLARLLAARRGVRNPQALPHFSVNQILRWCDEFYKRTGTWPTRQTRAPVISGAFTERWSAINAALQNGCRGPRATSRRAPRGAESEGAAPAHSRPGLEMV
jgi:hypothetical protein